MRKLAAWWELRISHARLPLEGEESCPNKEVGLSPPHLTELGTLWRVFRYLVMNNIQLGYRCLRGPKRERLYRHWRQRLERSQYESQCAERQ